MLSIKRPPPRRAQAGASPAPRTLIQALEVLDQKIGAAEGDGGTPFAQASYELAVQARPAIERACAAEDASQPAFAALNIVSSIGQSVAQGLRELASMHQERATVLGALAVTGPPDEAEVCRAKADVDLERAGELLVDADSMQMTAIETRLLGLKRSTDTEH